IEDLKNTTNEADFFLFGHTHSCSFEKQKNSYFINPGHLRKKSDKGRKPSYVVMDIDKDSITVCFKYVDGKVFRKEIINK
ncbi:MAG: metallophosphoesterase family protein, partial [Candidatus Cloacimonetes bacterium]|nr:metallophosphoesterase family protein [Candidatus Cloacimonadota bacterium]